MTFCNVNTMLPNVICIMKLDIFIMVLHVIIQVYICHK